MSDTDSASGSLAFDSLGSSLPPTLPVAESQNQASAQQQVQPPSLKYSPPLGYKALATAATLSVDSAQQGELWAIRLPLGVKPKHIACLELDLSNLAPSSGAVKVAEVQVRRVTYDVMAEITGGSKRHGKPAAPETRELEGLTPLLPDPRKGKERLVMTSTSVVKTLFLRRRLAASLPTSGPTEAPALTHPTESAAEAAVCGRPRQPQNLSKEGRFHPYGASSQGYQYPLPLAAADSATAMGWGEVGENQSPLGIVGRGTTSGGVAGGSPRKKRKKKEKGA